MPATRPPDPAWRPLAPDRARGLTDARLQCHHAAQLVAAAGVSFLPPEPDDGHTSLEWLRDEAMLGSRTVPAPIPFRVAVRPADLTLHLLDAAGDAQALMVLHGVTLEDAAVSLAGAAHALGSDVARFTLARPYRIPSHPVLGGAPFDAGRAEDFAELSDWFANADLLLREMAARTTGSSDVRCRPQRLDIRTVLLLGPSAGRRIGIGMSPGDEVYAEPYFYVSPDPAPHAEGPTLPSLAGRGRWHVYGWVGAVLTGSRLTPDPAGQRDQVEEFLRSSISACRRLLGAA